MKGPRILIFLNEMGVATSLSTECKMHVSKNEFVSKNLLSFSWYLLECVQGKNVSHGNR